MTFSNCVVSPVFLTVIFQYSHLHLIAHTLRKCEFSTSQHEKLNEGVRYCTYLRQHKCRGRGQGFDEPQINAAPSSIGDKRAKTHSLWR